MGRGSPRHGSRKRETRGALGVVAGKETQEKRLKLIEHIKPHNTKSRCRNPSNTYMKPPKFSVPSFRRVPVCNLTIVWVRPTAPLLATLSWFIRTIILKHAFQIPKYYRVFLYPNLENKMLHVQKHSNPFLISAITSMTIKPKTLFSIFHRSFWIQLCQPW